MDTIIFEIPIYCCDEREWQTIRDDYTKSATDLTNKTRMSQHFLTEKTGQWRYNFRIGYLTLRIDNLRNISILESLTTSQRISKTSPTRKPIYDYGYNKIGGSDIKISNSKDNEDIFKEILSELEQYKTTYYLDLSIFKLIGPAIDWKSLKK